MQAVPGRQLALSGDTETEASATTSSRRRRLPAKVERNPSAERRPARVSARDLAGTVRQLRSRLESLEEEQHELRAELALLRGDAEAYEGTTPSIFVTGWFRAALVLIVLAIVVVISVPWLMEVFEGGARESRPPIRDEAPVTLPDPPPSEPLSLLLGAAQRDAGVLDSARDSSRWSPSRPRAGTAPPTSCR